MDHDVIRTVIGAFAAAAALGLAGCGSQDGDTPGPSATAGEDGVRVEIANTINYGSFGTTTEIDCADGKSLNIGGSNNTLTVLGTCANVNVGGTDNRITVERVDNEISVTGFNNTLTYRDGDPTVSDTGRGNNIGRG